MSKFTLEFKRSDDGLWFMTNADRWLAWAVDWIERRWHHETFADRSPEPLPYRYDYNGNHRGPGFVRGVTSIRCPECKGTGEIDDPTRALKEWDGDDNPILICPRCGGYGDVCGRIVPALAGLPCGPTGQTITRIE